ncbi:class I glutamine amidotransferase-like protein [Phaeosphaeriaceae sp. PMI808]|nr:class I glutamine amidotransferase-like protein [Phaeosphaeriaceae sp. PMI808]
MSRDMHIPIQPTRPLLRMQNKFSALFLLALSIFSAAVRGQFENMTPNEFHRYNAERTLSIGYIVYNGFTPLDVFGPLDFLQRVSNDYNMTLSTISKIAGIVSSKNPGAKSIGWPVIARHSVDDAPPIDLLMVPGGIFLGNDTWIEDFIAKQFDAMDFVASVCTGAKSLAKAGVLDGKRATTNKYLWNAITRARYVHDGKIWTSSGVAAGMDMTYSLLKWLYGEEKVNAHINMAEYAPHIDPEWDPYSIIYNVTGANSSFNDIVGPLGYD